MDTDATPSEIAAAAARPWLRPILACGGRLVCALLVIGALSLVAIEREPARPLDRSAANAAAASELGIAFVPAHRLAPAQAAPAAGAGRLRLDAAGEPVRVEPSRGDQEQTLARGAFSSIEETHLRLTLTRDAPEPPPGLFVILARRAAEAANLSVIRTGSRGRITTKFGAVETLDAALSGDGRRVCTGFVTVEAQPVRIDGWLCAPLGQPPEPRTLACTLDALVVEDRADPATDAVFAEAERRRDPACGPIRALAAREPAGRTGSIVPRAAMPARSPTRNRTPRD